MSAVTIEEGYSLSGEVRDNVWEHIVIRYVMDEYYDECELKFGKPRNGRLMFYVNGKLKFTVDDVSELVFKRLNDFKEKQLGVPFNFSLGGGSQGLLETMTFDGQDEDDLGLLIENNFAGTFIGGISQFKFYNCDLNWCEISNLYENNMFRYSNIDDVIIPGEPSDNITIYVGKNNNPLMDETVLNSLSLTLVDTIDGFTTNLLTNQGYIYVVIPSNLPIPNKFVLGDNCDALPIPFNMSPNTMNINNTNYNVFKSFNKTYYDGSFKFC